MWPRQGTRGAAPLPNVCGTEFKVHPHATLQKCPFFGGYVGRLGNCTFLLESLFPEVPPKSRRAPWDEHPQALPVTCATKEKELESKGGSKRLCLPLLLSLQKAQKGSPRGVCTPKRAGFQASKQGGGPRSVRASPCAFQARPTTAPPPGRRLNLPSSAS